jgi:Flp pilus assembly pilin Flp
MEQSSKCFMDRARAQKEETTMQDLALRTYVALENMHLRVGDTLSNEKGQTAAEYVGILAFVAAVVAVIYAANSDIGDALVLKIQDLISNLGG